MCPTASLHSAGWRGGISLTFAIFWILTRKEGTCLLVLRTWKLHIHARVQPVGGLVQGRRECKNCFQRFTSIQPSYSAVTCLPARGIFILRGQEKIGSNWSNILPNLFCLKPEAQPFKLKSQEFVSFVLWFCCDNPPLRQGMTHGLAARMGEGQG